MPILQVKEISKAFGGVLALNRISFHVNEGEILGIIGPNGSGKTTLINCITGFIKASSGRVLFHGKEISGKPAHKIADMGVTRTFQIMRPYYSLPAYKNLVIPLFSPRSRRTGGWRGGGITLIMIEHRFRELFRVSDQVMVLNFGEKLMKGTAEEVMASEKVKRAYFGSEDAEEIISNA